MLYVCSLLEMPNHVRELAPSHLVSLVPREDQPERPRSVRAHLRLEIHDISEPSPGLVLPEREHMSELIDFTKSWSAEAPLLVHCIAGVSRSMAAAFVALCLENEGRELDAARLMRRAAPHASPNRRMVALADDLLGRGGALSRAREAMGEAVPTLQGPLVHLPGLPG